MIAKLGPRSHRRCAMLLAIFALLTCVGAVSVASESNVIKPKMLDRAQGHQLRGFQGYRSLRTFVEITKDDDDSEERVSNEFAKKMIQAAKNKLTSNNQATTNKLFKSLQVEGTGDKLFQSAQFEKWATTVAKNFKKNPEKAPTSMFSTLANHYGDEALAALLVTAKQNYQSRTVATKLENAQLQNWESAGKTGDDVFDLLKLNDKGEKLFESPVAATWISYMTKLNAQNSDEVIFSSLKKLYSDDVLAKMIGGAKNSANVGATAKKLEQVLLSKWMSEGKTIDDIFKLFKLNKEGEKLLQSPMLRTWISYVDFQGKNPYDLLLVKLSAHYDEAGLAKMLVVAKEDGKTPFIARKLEEVQLKNWQSGGKTPGGIFKLLKLDKEGDDILASPVLNTWSSYLASLNKGNPDELMFMKLQEQYGEAGLTSMIAKAKTSASTQSIAVKLQEEIWRSQGKTAEDVFMLLKLRKSGVNIVDAAGLSTWVSYVTKLNKLSKNPDEFVVISELEKQLTSMTLARMLAEKINKISLTNAEGAAGSVAGKLEALQFKKWLKQGATPNSIAATFTFARTDLRISVAYNDYYKLNFGKVTA
ncbi:RxLR effector protein [Phytophthora ramorum]|uniref:RxLR effector PexRD54 WY domain-containing protein n=1 Tax=Phytophthora ramorum TaxID=164328 RepID=H3GQM9_PHYRM|nr:RxLR effector protein [Phytophthora ramorum]